MKSRTRRTWRWHQTRLARGVAQRGHEYRAWRKSFEARRGRRPNSLEILGHIWEPPRISALAYAGEPLIALLLRKDRP